MVFASQVVNGYGANFLLLRRRGVSATRPFAAVLFRRPSSNLLSYNGPSVMQTEVGCTHFIESLRGFEDEQKTRFWRLIA